MRAPATDLSPDKVGCPSRTTAMSVDVPPMSKPMMFGASPSRASATAAATPPAGPDSAVPAASRVASCHRGDAAMRQDDQQFAVVSLRVQPGLQAAEVVLDHRADRGVGDGGGEPLELLDLRQHVGRGRDIDARQPLTNRVRGLLLMGRIAPGVQEADRDRLNIGHRASWSIAASSDARSSGISTDPSARIRSVTGRRRRRGTSGAGGVMRRL